MTPETMIHSEQNKNNLTQNGLKLTEFLMFVSSVWGARR